MLSFTARRWSVRSWAGVAGRVVIEVVGVGRDEQEGVGVEFGEPGMLNRPLSALGGGRSRSLIARSVGSAALRQLLRPAGY